MKILNHILISAMLAAAAPAILTKAYAVEIPTDISEKEKPATIKVLISNGKDKALLEVKGRYMIYDPFSGYKISEGILSKRSTIYSNESGLKWGERFPGIVQMRIVPGDSQSSILVDGIEYKGCIEIYDLRGKLHIVNEVDIERYLKATLSSELQNEYDEDVMDALAIVARTNAYYLVSRQPSANWHVESPEEGFAGYALTLQNAQVDRAINNTKHMVLTYNNAPFAAAWNKNSAGKTASFTSIFRKEISAPAGVTAPYAERERQKFGWTLSIAKPQLARMLGANKITGLDLYQEKQSGKVYAIRLKDGADTKNIDFFKLQKVLGPTKLLSNDFTVKVQGDTIVFSGFGEGHGVGLCLFSAAAMADNGADTKKILSTFFPDTKLENIRSFQATSNRR